MAVEVRMGGSLKPLQALGPRLALNLTPRNRGRGISYTTGRLASQCSVKP